VLLSPSECGWVSLGVAGPSRKKALQHGPLLRDPPSLIGCSCTRRLLDHWTPTSAQCVWLAFSHTSRLFTEGAGHVQLCVKPSLCWFMLRVRERRVMPRSWFPRACSPHFCGRDGVTGRPSVRAHFECQLQAKRLVPVTGPMGHLVPRDLFWNAGLWVRWWHVVGARRLLHMAWPLPPLVVGVACWISAEVW